VRHLRVDLKELASMKATLVAQIAAGYRSRKIRRLSQLISELAKGESRHE